jgi:RimJ/RimL family protein N-acetyltransferase
VLNNNERALRFDAKHGFEKTGVIKPLSGALWEIELSR